MLSIPAISISASLQRGLGDEPLPLRVLSMFDHACNLVAANGRVFCLVTPKVGNGPLNVVIEAKPAELPLPAAGGHAWVDSRCLHLGAVEIRIACAAWDPSPNWRLLRAGYPAMRARAQALLRLASRIAPEPGLLVLLDPDLPAAPATVRVIGVFREALADLQPEKIGQPEGAERLAGRVAGLGMGLTPAGDDWLAGLLIWAWLAHPQAEDLAAAIMHAAAPRTTLLSAAFLGCAAQAECDAPWQDFLVALASDPSSRLEAATRAILACGATSGADRLAGFLYPMLMATGEAHANLLLGSGANYLSSVSASLDRAST